MALRARHPLGAPTLPFDDYLGVGPVADFVRQTLQRHGDLIASASPGVLDRFSLVILGNPFGRKILPSRPSEEVSGVTYRVPSLRAPRFMRSRALPSQPLVAIVASTWEPHLFGNTRTVADLERIMANTLYHEICHVFGYPHGRMLNRLQTRFAERLRQRLSSETAGSS